MPVNNAELEQKFTKLVYADGAELASLAVCVVAENEMIYEGYFGNRFIDSQNPDKNLPVTADTKFRVASISKTVVAIAIMQLVEQGRLDLDQDISEYLGFRLRNPHYPEIAITTRMLLTHTSSIRDGSIYSIPLPYTMRDFFFEDGAFYRNGEHFAVPDETINPTPGEYFCYCNLNFGLMGTIIESVSGERFDLYIRGHIMQPLGIDASFNVQLLSDEGFANIATLYRKFDGETWDSDGAWYPQVDDYRGQRPEAEVRVENPDTGDSIQSTSSLDDYVLGTNGTLFSPQGGLRISAPDLAKIMQAFMSGGEYQGVRLLEEKTVADMMTIQWGYDADLKNGDNHSGLMCSWGLGLHDMSASGEGDRIEATGRFKAWGHSGEAYGLLSGMWFQPETKLGFVFMLGGVGANPEQHKGQYSSFYRWEEEIMTVVYDDLLAAYLG